MKPQRLGAREILLTSMDCDGTKDVSTSRSRGPSPVSSTSRSSPVGERARSSTSLGPWSRRTLMPYSAASVFHFGTYTVHQVKEAMAAAGAPVRL